MNTEGKTGKAGKKSTISVKEVAGAMERLAHLEAQINGSPLDERFLGNAKLTGLGIFRLIVMGEIKKGKSSFINALIGTENLVPVHSDVATSTIFKIHYGPKVKYTVYFEKDPDSKIQEKLPIEASQVNEYGTEDGNPGNHKHVDYIRVESPSAILNNGLVIVDTPGVGGLFKKHREITFRHAPNADAVFFITDSIEAPIGADEVRFLKELRQITQIITFIQTKATKADGEARKARMENNIGILLNEVGIPRDNLAYFIVDSGLKISADRDRDKDDLHDSGFLPLMSYLNRELRENQEVHVAKAALSRSMMKLAALEASLAQRKEILGADTVEKRKNLDLEIEDLQRNLTVWEKESKPRILEDFRKGVRQLSLSAQEELRPLQTGGVIQSEFESVIDKAESVEQVKALMAQVQSDLAALTSAACMKISENAKSGVSSLLETLTKDIIKTMEVGSELKLSAINQDKLWVNTGAIDRAVSKDTSAGFYEEARNAVYGGMAGMAIASVVGGILGSVIPVVGTIAGSWLGMMAAGAWGSSMAGTLVAEQKLDLYKKECYAALQQSLTSAYQSALAQVNILVSDMQTEATTMLQKMMEQANENLVKMRSDLNQRNKSTQQEIIDEKKRIAGEEGKLLQIKKVFESTAAALNRA